VGILSRKKMSELEAHSTFLIFQSGLTILSLKIPNLAFKKILANSLSMSDYIAMPYRPHAKQSRISDALAQVLYAHI
jgi:hypothetical protein